MPCRDAEIQAAADHHRIRQAVPALAVAAEEMPCKFSKEEDFPFIIIRIPVEQTLSEIKQHRHTVCATIHKQTGGLFCLISDNVFPAKCKKNGNHVLAHCTGMLFITHFCAERIALWKPGPDRHFFTNGIFPEVQK